MICKVCNEEVNEFNLLDVFGVNKHNICNKCFNKFNVINEKTKINNIECFSIYSYEGLINELIFQFKGQYDYELKDIFLEYFKDEIELKYLNYTITYAPSFSEDDNKRGFNHVEEICSSLSNKKVKLFIKKENYKQSDKSFNERTNISKYISLNKNNLKGIKRVLIVDDVLTTGNTLKACASLLYKEGIKDIKFLTICKVVDFIRNNEHDIHKKSIKDVL